MWRYADAPLDPIFQEDYDSYEDSSKDSNQDSNEDYSIDSNQDSNETDFVEGITQEKCGSFIDFDKCVARQTMDALKNVMIWGEDIRDLCWQWYYQAGEEKVAEAGEDLNLHVSLHSCKVKPWLMVIK